MQRLRQVVCKSKVSSGKLSFFGDKLIQTNLVETEEQELSLPFSFNHSWKFQHICQKCDGYTFIQEDFDNKTRNFKVISNINSENYDKSLIYDISVLFSVLYVYEVDNVFFLNRSDFDYSFDFQRNSSVNLIEFCCSKCGAIFLGLIRISSPLLPEKNIPYGKLGVVDIEEIIEINKPIKTFLKNN